MEELRQKVEQYEAHLQQSYEEQSALALEDRKAAMLRAMTSSNTRETIDLMVSLI